MSQVEIRVADLPTDLPHIHQIRYVVFQIEQGVAPELEFDDQDEEAQHLLAYLEGQPVGTARLRSLDAQTAKIERVAVLRSVRGLGIGKQLMEQALAVLAAANVAEAQIHAQTAVEVFYQRLGFEPEGAPFEEAGIPHITMRKRLR